MATAAAIFALSLLASGGFQWPRGGPALAGLRGLSLCYVAGIVLPLLVLPRVGPTPPPWC